MRTLAVAALMLTLAVLVLGCGTHARTLQEDDAGWDCHTMGNRICGTLGNGR